MVHPIDQVDHVAGPGLSEVGLVHKFSWFPASLNGILPGWRESLTGNRGHWADVLLTRSRAVASSIRSIREASSINPEEAEEDDSQNLSDMGRAGEGLTFRG